MTDQPQPPPPDSPAPLEPDAGKTVVRQVPEVTPGDEETTPAAPVAESQSTVVHGTVPASPPPDVAAVSEPRPPDAAETYAKPSAPSPTDWTAPGDAGTATPSADGTGAPAPSGSILDEKPELAIGGAFAGGLVLALILKRLAR